LRGFPHFLTGPNAIHHAVIGVRGRANSELDAEVFDASFDSSRFAAPVINVSVFVEGKSVLLFSIWIRDGLETKNPLGRTRVVKRLELNAGHNEFHRASRRQPGAFAQVYASTNGFELHKPVLAEILALIGRRDGSYLQAGLKTIISHDNQ